MWEYVVIIAAGIGAGFVNAIAGGGTFLSFPALVWIGVPPIAANATSTLAVLPGYFSAAVGFREELREFNRADLGRAVLVSLAGGLLGGILLLVSNDRFFDIVVPFLLLIATLVFTFQARLLRSIRRGDWEANPFGVAGLFAVSVYGGYFNGGLGIIMLALFSYWGLANLAAMNGLKSLLSVVISAISATAFAVAGLIWWTEMFIMGGSAIVGAYAGARLSRILPTPVVRAAISTIGFGLTVIFFLRI